MKYDLPAAQAAYDAAVTRLGEAQENLDRASWHLTACKQEQRLDPRPYATTDLAVQIADSGRMGDSAYFDELAALYGPDFTGTAFVQAFLKAGSEDAA